MSTATFYPPPSLHLQLPVSSISPHLLHSPNTSPAAQLQQYLTSYPMNSYSNPYPSPSQSRQPIYPLPATSATSATSTSVSAPVPSITPSDTSTPVVSHNGMITVHSYTPSTGQSNTCIVSRIDFSSNLHSVRLRLVFGDVPRPTIVEANPDRLYTQSHGNWTLKAYVPPVDQVSVHLAATRPDGCLEWPLSIQALDTNNNVLDSVTFGTFSYDDYSLSPGPSASTSTYDYSSLPLKRLHIETTYPSTTPVKRITDDDDIKNLRRLSVASDTQAYPNALNLPMRATRSSYVPTPSNRTGTTISPQRLTQKAMSLPSSSFLPQSFLNLNLSTGRKRKRSRSNPISNSSVMASSASNETTTAKSLVRTSQLGSQMAEPAIVVFRQDPETMKHSWNEDELAANRRLVQFWKRQVDNRLEISFTPVSQESYKENTLVVSCIYREDINDYFITSVDVIYLLESLSGGRFQVEEKNRIRRNLEGFKPLTVSKTKPGTEDFFRVIMEFPLPRPRNIEKDVKVFEWRKLKDMLDKVFSKYSTIPAGSFSSSESMDTEDIDLLESDYDYEDHKKAVKEDRDSDISSNDVAQNHYSNSINTHPQTKHEVPYPEIFLDQMQKMNGEANDSYSGGSWDIYDSSNMYGVDALPRVKSESYSPLSLLNGYNNTLGSAYDQLRAKSSPSSNHSPLSATMSISSIGSSDNGYVNETTDYSTPSFG